MSVMGNNMAPSDSAAGGDGCWLCSLCSVLATCLWSTSSFRNYSESMTKL